MAGKASFDIFVVASGVTNDTQKRALLLHMGGGQLKNFHTLPDTGDETDYAVCVQALNKYFEIRKNVPNERQNFLPVSPDGGETINNFIIRLKKQWNTVSMGLKKKTKSEIVF